MTHVDWRMNRALRTASRIRAELRKATARAHAEQTASVDRDAQAAAILRAHNEKSRVDLADDDELLSVVHTRTPSLVSPELVPVLRLVAKLPHARPVRDWQPRAKGRSTRFVSLLEHLFASVPVPSVRESLDGYRGTGQAASVLSGRLAYVLGLQDRAITVDTACSSRSSRCTSHALPCGRMMRTRARWRCPRDQRALHLRRVQPSASALACGRCKSFSADADGAVWAEGCGVLVLKRLSDAERDGDGIVAVMRGSAVNEDGRRGPDRAERAKPAARRPGRASASSLSRARHRRDRSARPGTTLGDPIETGALAAGGASQPGSIRVYLGSSKSNIGHAQAAAGVLGLIKIVLSLEQELLPAAPAEQPSHHIAWEGSGLSLLQEARPWLRGATASGVLA